MVGGLNPGNRVVNSPPATLAQGDPYWSRTNNQPQPAIARNAFLSVAIAAQARDFAIHRPLRAAFLATGRNSRTIGLTKKVHILPAAYLPAAFRRAATVFRQSALWFVVVYLHRTEPTQRRCADRVPSLRTQPGINGVVVWSSPMLTQNNSASPQGIADHIRRSKHELESHDPCRHCRTEPGRRRSLCARQPCRVPAAGLRLVR